MIRCSRRSTATASSGCETLTGICLRSALTRSNRRAGLENSRFKIYHYPIAPLRDSFPTSLLFSSLSFRSRGELMRNTLSMIVFLAFAAICPAQQTPPASHFDGDSWWSHVKFLADDALEGRDTGSEGLRKAEAYAVEQLQKAGLEPAGTKGFFQPVPLIQYQVDEAKSSLALVTNGQSIPLSFADDAFISSRTTHASTALTAPLVFVGYGLRIPEKSLDELARLDLKGKIAVYLAGSPSDIPTALASHYQTAGERWKFLHAAGAIGIISIFNPASMDIPWSRISVNRNHPSMDLADPEFNETPGLELGVACNPASAEPLFAGSGHTFAEIAALGKDRKPLPRFDLAVSLKANAVILTKTLESY